MPGNLVIGSAHAEAQWWSVNALCRRVVPIKAYPFV